MNKDMNLLNAKLIKAAKAYDKKAKELFGEFANLNFKEKINELLCKKLERSCCQKGWQEADAD